jgi:uncharacterized protein
MEFIVVGREQPGVVMTDAEEDALNEEHWAYMDSFASQLVARGPILSIDGNDWAGSVHIVRVDDRIRADQFAYEEPYFLAGLYAAVEVSRFDDVLRSTMWERDRDLKCETSWLARWELPSTHMDSAAFDSTDVRANNAFVFAGFLMSDDELLTHGFIAGIDASVDNITQIINQMSKQLSIDTAPILTRWRRGGRPTAQS